jgi:hypothetical protein
MLVLEVFVCFVLAVVEGGGCSKGVKPICDDICAGRRELKRSTSLLFSGTLLDWSCLPLSVEVSSFLHQGSIHE